MDWLEPIFDAPISTLLVVAGLLFLLLAVAGRVGNWFDLSTPWERWISFFLGGLLLASGLAMFATTPTPPPNGPIASPTPTATTTSPSPSPQAEHPFVGLWTNVDVNTRSNTKLAIRREGDQYWIHAWGKCHPEDCNWGEEQLLVTENEGKVTWDQDFVIRKMSLPLDSRDRLQVVTNSIYDDSRPRRQSQQAFAKVQVLRPRPPR